MNGCNCSECICRTCMSKKQIPNCCLIHPDLPCPGKVCLDYERDKSIKIEKEDADAQTDHEI